jgi:hypothetical protein
VSGWANQLNTEKNIKSTKTLDFFALMSWLALFFLTDRIEFLSYSGFLANEDQKTNFCVRIRRPFRKSVRDDFGNATERLEIGQQS